MWWGKKEEKSKCVKWILVDKNKQIAICSPRSYTTVRWVMGELMIEAKKSNVVEHKAYSFHGSNYQGYVVKVDEMLLELMPLVSYQEWIL